MRRVVGSVVALVGLLAAACGTGPADEGPLTVYSGRSEELVGELIERFRQETGIRVDVRYGDTAELAAQILEEGDNSPADVFWAQDAGALGAVSAAGRFGELPGSITEGVGQAFRSPRNLWVGVTGRVRVLVYNTDNVAEAELPSSVLGLTDPAWRGRVGWAPTNGSFQAFVTALRKVEGEERARSWLEGMAANDPQIYEGNSAIVKAVAAGEVDTGLVNHYYLFQIGAEDPAVREGAANHFFEGGDVGSLVNVAGAGILRTAPAPSSAERFIEFLLSRASARYFADEVFEYSLTPGVSPADGLPPLSDIEQPNIDLDDLEDLEGTLELLRSTGVL